MFPDSPNDSRIAFNNLASSFSQSGKFWTDGDFNYDGTVDTVDFNLLASNFGQTVAAPAHASALGAVVPEPGTATLLLTGAVTGLMSRRRRR